MTVKEFWLATSSVVHLHLLRRQVGEFVDALPERRLAQLELLIVRDDGMGVLHEVLVVFRISCCVIVAVVLML